VILAGSGSNERLFLLFGAISGFLAVAVGAFGAHALADLLPPDRLAVFETGARYQMFHALALVGTALVVGRRRGRAAPAAAWLFALGTVLFSGSLYILALSGVRAWGAVTPLGGVAWLAGWALLGVAALRPRTLVVRLEDEEVVERATSEPE
jgi:uncharacterized membrane protein YgdD (TMEM256/DUF423 family)